MALRDVERQFIEWLVMDRASRVSVGLPTTEKAYSEAKGLNARTLRRWKEKPEFVEALFARKRELASRSGMDLVGIEQRAEVILADMGELPDAEREYHHVKGTIVRMASEGNAGAMDLYMKHWGRPFAQAEVDGDELGELPDDELVSRVLGEVGVDRVAAWLAAQ